MAAICVFCASSDGIAPTYLDLAAETGAELGRRGHTLVSGGGCVSMMGRLADAARAAGARTVGIIPVALQDREVADLAADELVVTADMAERKAVMVSRSDAFIGLPGGLGTLDEIVEVWTTLSIGLHAKPVVVVNPDGFYDGLFAWVDRLVDGGFVRPTAKKVLVVTETVDEALTAVESALAAG